MMIAISVFSILITIAQPVYFSAITKAKEATLRHDLFVLRDVIDRYYGDQGEYPPTLESLVEKRYLRSIPVDPFTESSETWVIITSALDKFDIFDVHSGSDLVGRNGVAYNVW